MHSYPVSDTKFLGLFSAKVWIVRGFYGGARIVTPKLAIEEAARMLTLHVSRSYISTLPECTIAETIRTDRM